MPPTVIDTSACTAEADGPQPEPQEDGGRVAEGAAGPAEPRVEKDGQLAIGVKVSTTTRHLVNGQVVEENVEID